MAILENDFLFTARYEWSGETTKKFVLLHVDQVDLYTYPDLLHVDQVDLYACPDLLHVDQVDLYACPDLLHVTR